MNTITTYQEIQTLYDDFQKGYYDLIIIQSLPGMGKTNLTQNNTTINGHITPMQAYITAHKNKDQPIIIDDIQTLWKNPNMRDLLVTLCDTTPTKNIQWNSTALPPTIPTQFQTTSKVLILCNNTKKIDEAIQSRAHTYHFQPTHQEKIRQATKYTPTQITQFINNNLQDTEWNLRDCTKTIQTLNARKNCQCQQQQKPCTIHDWKKHLLIQYEKDKLLRQYQQLQNTDNTQEAQQITQLTRQQIWRLKKKLQINGTGEQKWKTNLRIRQNPK